MFGIDYCKKVWKRAEGKYWAKKGFSTSRFFPLKRDMKNDYKSSNLSSAQKKWAAKRGFYTYRIQQYGLTDDNYHNVISDWDYEYLYPMNHKVYQQWIENKLTMRYTLEPFKEYLPKYFYHLLKNRDVMRLMDCPQNYPASLDGVIECIRAFGIVAAKKARGSHGVGFYKIEANGDSFNANGDEYSLERFKDFLLNLDDYVITEYVKMHPLFEKLNPVSVNTIRITAINEHGNDPILPFAFLRIGTKKSGVTDNLGAGGMVCKVNVNNGVFYDAETLSNHVFTKVKEHPDTHELVEGTIPHWDEVKKGVIKICEYMPALEWLGFDIAITEDGFRIIEINRSQNLHKAFEYPPEVKGYLFRKLEQKKAKYGLH